MFRVLRDPALPVALTPALHRLPLPFDAAPLRARLEANVTLRTDATSFTIEKARLDIATNGVRILDNIVIADTTPDIVEITSIGVARAFRAGSIEEYSLLLPGTHDVFVEWVCDVDTLAVKWTCVTQHTGDVAWNTHDSALIVRVGACSVSYVFDVHTTWNVSAAADGVALVAHITPSSARARLRATVTGMRDGDHVRSDADPAMSARAIIASQKRRLSYDLAIILPDAAWSDALQWAKHAVAAYEPAPAAHTHDTARRCFLRTLAALVAGNIEVARSLITRQVMHTWHAPTPTRTGDDAILLLMLARYQSFTGDTTLLHEHHTHISCAIETILRNIGTPDGLDQNSIIQLIEALASIADAAGDAGNSVLAAELNPRVRRLRIDHAASLRSTSWVDAVGIADVSITPPSIEACINAPEDVILPVYYRLLDAAPEAVRHRFRIAPAIPRHWASARILNARMGETSFNLSITQTSAGSSRRYRFEAVQEEGGVPMRLILEPRLPMARIARVRIDDTVAELDPVPEGDFIRIPVQLVLDELRVLEVETEA